MGNSRNKQNRTIGVELQAFEHCVINVETKNDFSMLVSFDSGAVKYFDCKLLLDVSPVFNKLRDDFSLFSQARAAAGGVVWTDEIDISSEYIWDHGITTKTAFSGLIGMTEATERWGLNESTIRKAIANNRLEEDIDYKKMGRQYILTEASVRRLFGPELAEIKPDEFVYPAAVMKRYKGNKRCSFRLSID